MIFDKEHWPISGDPSGSVMYGSIMKNTVTVRPESKAQYKVYIHAPGGVLPLLHSLVSMTAQDFVDGLVAKPVRFYLDQHESSWIFGFTAFGEAYDLWTYSDLPFWGRA